MHIVVVNGYPRSGKDEFVNLCKETKIGYVYNFSTINFVKRIARECGWDGTKTLENRKFLSDLKDLLTKWDDIPFKDVRLEISLALNEIRTYGLDENKLVCFVHVREPKEIQKFKDRLNAQTLCIRRASVENNETSNHADAEVYNFDYDFYIDNNGTIEDLSKAAETFMKGIVYHT